MIMYVRGNLFESPAKVLVNTVNTVGVMGKGIAKTFKEIYPEMFRQYQMACERKQLQVGKLWLFKTDHKWILNFPTKTHWRQPSKPEYVKQGLETFVATYAAQGITSVAFPRLGCGNGELDWRGVVRPMMAKYLRKLAIDIFIYEFDEGNCPPEHRDTEAMAAWLRSEPRNLAFSEVWTDLCRVIGLGAELQCWDKSARFRVSLTSQPSEGLLIETTPDDVRRSLFSRLMKQFKDRLKPKLVSSGNVFVPQESMLDLWQSIRAYGFCVPSAMPEGLDVLSPYITALLSRLEYMKPAEISPQSLYTPGPREIGLRLFAAPSTSHAEQSEFAYLVHSA
jgi:O-acetyl-ADP-ribose deacetylase (regulator of RNase III)